MNMDAITTLNDAVGGVTVTVKDDFSEVDPTITKGEVKLMGQQAINFVRTRKGVADQLNISRMERQREYMHGFVKALQEKKDDTSFALTTYDSVSDYIVTDCSSTVFNNMLQRYADYPIVELVSPEGENVMADYYEFHVDEEKLDDLILRLFYAPK
jgi:anionic cell wall polymer biosynthesis LytR-Cps2A-Psr (LCP) family protein